ncbi:hypothetical protein B9Z55_025752 [Caenorhabditis nigoni]|nr:hypothetical protein B9Z55_025752 [Caenorhabditis nigoni]
MIDHTEDLGKMYDEVLEDISALDMTTQRHRRCCICNDVKIDGYMKNVTMDSEKLLLILGCLFRKEISMIDAREFLTRPAKTYVCHFHFTETIDTLYERLQITCPYDIYKCSADILQKTFESVCELRVHTTFTQYIKILLDFLERYDHMRSPTRQDLLDYYTTLVEPSCDDPRVQAVEEEVAGMLHETEGLGNNYNEALECSSSLDMPKQRHQDIHNSRRCCICNDVKIDGYMKNVTMDNEKLLLILGCVFRNEISMIDAHGFLTRPAKTYVCVLHFKETIDTLYEKLQITCPYDIYKCSADILQKTFESMCELRVHTTFTQYIKILLDFLERYDHMRAP